MALKKCEFKREEWSRSCIVSFLIRRIIFRTHGRSIAGMQFEILAQACD